MDILNKQIDWVYILYKYVELVSYISQNNSLSIYIYIHTWFAWYIICMYRLLQTIYIHHLLLLSIHIYMYMYILYSINLLHIYIYTVFLCNMYIIPLSLAYIYTWSDCTFNTYTQHISMWIYIYIYTCMYVRVYHSSKRSTIDQPNVTIAGIC